MNIVSSVGLVDSYIQTSTVRKQVLEGTERLDESHFRSQ